MPDTHLEKGCLLQDLIKHLGVAAQLDKANLLKDNLLAIMLNAIGNADPSRYKLTAPPFDDPLGPERTIPLTMLPRFMRRLSWDRIRVCRIKAGASDAKAEEDRNELAPKAAPAGTAPAEVPQSPTETRSEGAEEPEPSDAVPARVKPPAESTRSGPNPTFSTRGQNWLFHKQKRESNQRVKPENLA
jgi:hypothetical protein